MSERWAALIAWLRAHIRELRRADDDLTRDLVTELRTRGGPVGRGVAAAAVAVLPTLQRLPIGHHSIDTAAKRASSLVVLQPWQLAPVIPDGSIDQGDRQHQVWCYSGILAVAGLTRKRRLRRLYHWLVVANEN